MQCVGLSNLRNKAMSMQCWPWGICSLKALMTGSYSSRTTLKRLAGIKRQERRTTLKLNTSLVQSENTGITKNPTIKMHLTGISKLPSKGTLKRNWQRAFSTQRSVMESSKTIVRRFSGFERLPNKAYRKLNLNWRRFTSGAGEECPKIRHQRRCGIRKLRNVDTNTLSLKSLAATKRA